MAQRPFLSSLLCLRLACGTGVLATALGCESATDGSHATLTYTEDARAAYNEALEAYRDKEWEDAKALFNQVKKLFGYSPYARLAELRIADIEFEQEKWTEAITAYRDFIHSHRSDRDVEYARFRLAKALFNDIDDTIFLPPAEERDQSSALEAHKELTAYMKEYPKSRYRVQADYMLRAVTGRLVRHELYVARYYARHDGFEAAIARCDYALTKYAGSDLDAETLVLKGETLLKMKKVDEARAVFERVIREYGAPFGTVAKNFLAQISTGPH